jgi:hypothetical protein
MGEIVKKKTMEELQLEVGKLDIERSKAQEKVCKINLEQQQILTQMSEIALEQFKSKAFQSSGNIFTPR